MIRAYRNKYYEAGVKAVWGSLNPHEDDACFDAWFEYAPLLSNSESEEHGDRILIQFAWGWKWASDRFRDPWIGVPADKRGVGMEVLWR